MCGIVYKKSFDGMPVSTAVIQLYKNQKHRGSEGFGFYDFSADMVLRATREDSILRKLKHSESSAILYHHRFPTSTDNVVNASHPFVVTIGKKKYVTVHNGVVTNSHELKTKHEKLGFKYTSMQSDGRFNDSEALAHELALYLSGKQKTMSAIGSIAFITTQGKKIFFGRNSGSPLQYRYKTDSITIASEISGSDVAEQMLYTFDGNSLKHEPMAIENYQCYVAPSYTSYGDDTYWYHYKREQEVIEADMFNCSNKEYPELCQYYRGRVDMLLKERRKYYGEHQDEVYTAKVDAILDWFDYNILTENERKNEKAI